MVVEAIAGALGQGFQMAGQFAQARNTKMQGILADKQGFQDTQSRLLQLRQQREFLRQQREAQMQLQKQEQSKTQRTTIIVIAAVVAILILAVIVIFTLKSKK